MVNINMMLKIWKFRVVLATMLYLVFLEKLSWVYIDPNKMVNKKKKLFW